MASKSKVRAQEVVYTTDPSALTTDAIEREVNNITSDLKSLKQELQRDLENRQETRQREQDSQDRLFDVKIQGIQETFETRIGAIDKATSLRLDEVSRVPQAVEKEIGHHEDLQKERFRSIDKQFDERDIRTDQAGKASTEALAAALQAAKELVGAQGEASAAAAIKSETSFTKQIDQIGTIIQTLEKSMDARITELKERIDRGEGSSAGSEMTQSRATEASNAALLAAVNTANAKRSQSANIVAVIGVVLVLVTIGVSIVSNILTSR